MIINEDYKEIECIKRLKNENKDKFFDIVKNYANELPEKLILEGSVFTLHDFNHHCINLYKIISEVIFNSVFVYEGEKALTDKELFILDLAVLFHDVGMNSYLDSSRGSHSKLSSKYVDDEYQNSSSVLKRVSDLNVNEIKALKLVILAHSDVKDGSIAEEKNGLKNPELSDNMPAHIGSIRARFLASILRLADEMDVTVDRLGNSNIENQLDNLKRKLADSEIELKCLEGEIYEKKEKECKELKKKVNSLDHWRHLHLFTVIRRESLIDKAYLHLNDDYISHCIEQGESYEKLAEDVISIFTKIENELNYGLIRYLNESKNKLILSPMIAIKEIFLYSDIEEMTSNISKLLYRIVSSNGGEVKEEYNEIRDELDSKERIFDKITNDVFDLDKRIQPELMKLDENKIHNEDERLNFNNMIKHRQLLKVGHFLLDDVYCARDWIDTKEIIETREISDKIVKYLIQHINTKYKSIEDYIIVGIDLEGAVIAGRVAMGLQKPISYLIPRKFREQNSYKDDGLPLNKFEKYIIITDSIVTFETIKRTIQDVISIKQIIQIYTVFYRSANNFYSKENEELIKKTACISKDFNVELFLKKNCSYKDEGCFALNRTVK